ncbi:uncharacterized protein LOC131658146 [Vicia villosa]|uniref:uncharacterized protein LOC131658146 n=1 Tax=Vicia villosa TaxID=3911 RepID=UPI00273B36CC|nr:uncharacterized protein LOC131658146 [Vicia villosa]
MVNKESKDEQDVVVPPTHAYTPHANMSNLNLDGDEPSSDIFFDLYIQSDELLKVGDKFRSKEAYVKRSDSWVIGSISQEHTCVNTNSSQDHRKLSYDLICQEILPHASNDPSLKEDSYKQLARFLTALQIYAPDTVSILETLPMHDPEGTCVQGNGIFHRLFYIFQPCIRGFAYCKPVLQIGGAWLYGKYKRTLLMVIAQYGNNNIFPIALTLVEGETAGGWSFFLKNLQTYISPQPDLCLISDRHASIESAYNNPANGWHKPPSKHVHYIRYITQNFMREVKDKFLQKTFVNAGYPLTQQIFQHYRREIVLSNLNVGMWIDNLAKEIWTSAYDNKQRWSHITNNLVESMNGVFKGIQNLPITALIRSTYFRMASLFATRDER